MNFKDLFKSNIVDYSRASACGASKRFVAAAIDFFILIVVSLCFYFASYAIVTSIPGYQEVASTVTQEVEYYNDYIAETRLAEFREKDGKLVRKDTQEVAIKILLSNLKYSYLNDTMDSFNDNYDVEEKLKNYEPTSIESDNILYFLSEYVPSHNILECMQDKDENPLTPNAFYKYAIDKASGNDAFFNHTFTKYYPEQDNLFFIRPDVANRIIGFLFYENKDHTAQTEYNDTINVYIRILNDLENVMLFQEDYQQTHYVAYKHAYHTQATYIVVSLILNLLVSYSLVIVLPQLLFKDGRTIAKRIFNIGLIHRDGTKVKRYSLLVKNILGFFGQFITLYLIPILPIFNFGYYSFNVPFIGDEKLGLSLGTLILIAGIGAVVLNITVPVLKRKTSLIDLATLTYCVDGKYLDETDYEEPRYEGE